MKMDFLFSGLNLNVNIQDKKRQTNANYIDDALKTRGIKYLYVEIWMLFAPSFKISGHAPAVTLQNLALPIEGSFALTGQYRFSPLQWLPYLALTVALSQWLSTWSRAPQRGCEPFLRDWRVDISYTQRHDICFIRILDWGCLVIREML